MTQNSLHAQLAALLEDMSHDEKLSFWQQVVTDATMANYISRAIDRLNKQRLAEGDLAEAIERMPVPNLWTCATMFGLLQRRSAMEKRQLAKMQRKKTMATERLQRGKQLLDLIAQHGGSLSTVVVNAVVRLHWEWPCVRNYLASHKQESDRERLRSTLKKLVTDTKKAIR
jgi:hypothetical protein